MKTDSAQQRNPVRARNPVPAITYPEDLPVSARREEIAAAIRRSQVVIVSGETGSGKTTQLPKICLEIGRGEQGLIGHTQPRRIAATSVAQRIAQELATPLGEVVGYQVRFSDRVQPGASVKLMTDGVLLAESQRDPMLRRYDTIIIDEAHERSLNIDFLLGYLRQLLPRRPDLKLIITSATLDAERFATHFADKAGRPAPVVEVSGRLYPVDIRYRPIREPQAEEAVATSGRQSRTLDDERDRLDALIDAVHECERHGPGDILVFLPGEREIRDAAEALKAKAGAATEILPLFARLTQAEQERVFHPKGSGRRVVLATNVAETSLTVPGIRFVIDTGLARVKRYSWRSKVEQLRVEPVSQASANQRAGRCGRLGPGVCIRLYDEADFQARPLYGDPEILRSSLASVILRMKDLRLDDIERFPFVEAPGGRAIADGYHLLQELGALDDNNKLTRVGRTLARMPVDPRVARMILAARDQACLREVLVIAAALSVQDPRDRPLAAQEAADAAHAKFADERSEFLSYWKLWLWHEAQIETVRGSRKLAALLRENFLSPSRMREWRDVHTQLLLVVKEAGWTITESAATYEQVHLALLTGLLGNIGLKSDEAAHYLGARGIQFYLHPGSRLARKGGRWVMAAELVETTRLYARCLARIEPTWLERVAGHLLQRNWSDPRWEKKAGQVVANERGSLYGLPVYNGRRVHFGRIDRQQAREIFIRDGLVPGELATTLPFVAHNRRLVAEIEKLEHKSRRPDILVDDGLIQAFYERHVPVDICQTSTLESWYQKASREEGQSRLLYLTRDELMRHEAAGITTEVFPKTLQWQGVSMAVDYHFEPGSPRDGVTLSVPLYSLNQMDAVRAEWLVPGMLKEKVQALLRSLPQKLRRHCVPLPEYAAGFYERWFERLEAPGQGLLEALVRDIQQNTSVRPTVADFKLDTLPPHLFMNFRVVDEHGRMLGMGRNLAQLRAEHAQAAQATFQAVAARDQDVAQALAHEQLTAWTFGPLPELLEIRRGGQVVMGYPALIDKGTHCELDVFDDPEAARSRHRAGLRRLFRLQLREQMKYLEKNLDGLTRMGMLFLAVGTQESLRDQILDRAIELACMASPWPENEAAFAERVSSGRGRIGLLAQEVARRVETVLTEWAALQRKLPQARPHPAAYADIEQQSRELIGPYFVRDTPYDALGHFPRYFKAAQARIDKLRADPARDARLLVDVHKLQANYQRERAARKGVRDERLDDFGWLLQELRVALFAQELRTPTPVSIKRLEKAWQALRQ